MTFDAAMIWVVILGLSVGTFVLRASFLLGIDWLDGLPPAFEQALPYVPTAVFAALVAPRLLLVDGSLTITPQNERLVAGLVGIVVAWYTENIIATVTAGMATLWLILWL